MTETQSDKRGKSTWISMVVVFVAAYVFVFLSIQALAAVGILDDAPDWFVEAFWTVYFPFFHAWMWLFD